MRISDWSSDVCSSDLGLENRPGSGRVGFPPDGGVGLLCMVAKGETAKRDEGRMGGSFRAAKGDGVGKSVGEEGSAIDGRSEEHTSELQSLMRNSYAVSCLKKKTSNTQPPNAPTTLYTHQKRK